MVSLKRKDTLEKEDKSYKEPEQATVQYLLETLQNLQKENAMLKRDILKSKKTPSGKIGFALLAVGALALTGSVPSESIILAFIGLGLTFWGALFLFARPLQFVRGSVLDSTAISSYTTIDRITEDLAYKGRPIYIPPYPKEAYLPEYLKGLKEMIVYIPAENTVAVPTVEEMAKKHFFLKDPRGVSIAPPGYGLVGLFEKELRAEFTQIDLERLYGSLPTVIVSNLELASGFEMNLENDLFHVKIVDSVYRDLYSSEQGFKSVHSVGCPLVSAIACALAKTSAKLVSIAKDYVSADLRTIEVWYKTLEV